MIARIIYFALALCLTHSALPIGAPAVANAGITIDPPPGFPIDPGIDFPPDFPFPRIPSELELDVERNSAYSPATKAALVDQILTDFAEFDQQALRPGGTRPTGGALGYPVISDPPLRLERVIVEDPLEFEDVAETCVASRPCALPLDYNVSVPTVRLIWSFRSSTVSDRFDDYINGNGDASLVVELNDDALVRRPNIGIPVRGTEYTATFETGSNCRPLSASSCMVLEIFSSAWFDGPAPWSRWQVTVKGVNSPFGQGFPQVRYTAGHLVTPKSTVKDFFTQTIGKSTMSERCTTCHQLDEVAEIQAQHSSPVTVELLDSIVNDDEMINGCENCHEGDLPPHFLERRWATPTPQQDINWAEIIGWDTQAWPTEICERIVSNLDTFSKRHEHFHEDARLFWAVADGVTPFGDALPTSHPKDYDVFLDHFDTWNRSGAPCPVPEPGITASLAVGGLLMAASAQRRRRS